MNEQQILQHVLELVQSGLHQEALKALDGGAPDEKFRSSYEYAKAMVYCRMGRKEEGASLLSVLVAREPGFLDAGPLLAQLRLEGFGNAPRDASSGGGGDLYGKVLLNPATMAAIASAPETWEEILAFHSQLATDEYVRYVDRFYRECVRSYGRHWHYLDAVNVLYAAAKTIRPARYLEIGVRRGRSVCAVAKGHPDVDVYAFDMWVQGYAGMENPGPAFVKQELARAGHRGRVEFVDGDSHKTLPAFFRANPGLRLDLIMVDGDHSENGAMDDLAQVIPHLALGGLLVMDDIVHPEHPYLLDVWNRALALHPGLVSHEFTEGGYGVAFAIKKA